ncbi:MAG: ADP-glyceromanno-heptose 6-epimerase [Candidatus Omnitrophota bacterium]|nr:MAG: ADP-glyceromanno-heptose 6-epimerase [Candidatus Omnitrophota bacterium]
MKVILTGGAGFIGSCLLWKLNENGITDILVVDHLDDLKWKNLINKKFTDYIEKDEFIKFICEGKVERPDFLIHLGACTRTTEKNASYIINNNYIYSRKLAEWAVKNNVNFLYASSAATYGGGENGFSDDDKNTLKLKPLNLYGFSKHLFDLWVINNGLSDRFVGFKFFNVFGPNEYHKKDMKSVVAKAFYQIKENGVLRLFKSYRSDFKDGEQKRDFIYVKDVVDVIYYFIENPDKKGIFNVGTGKARSFNELGECIFEILGKEKRIEYIDMPEDVKKHYQYFTKANIEKLRRAGYDKEFTDFKRAISEYIEYLKEGKHL